MNCAIKISVLLFFQLNYSLLCIADGENPVIFRDLGNKHVKIVGGTVSKGKSWPWVAALVQQDQSGTIQYCGGSILNSYTILTAAHCTFDLSEAKLGTQYIYVGDHKINGSHVAKHKIESIKMHPQFKRQTLDNDLALVRLASPIDFNAPGQNVGPICLGRNSNSPPVGQTAVVIGWGSIRNNGPTVNSQRQVQVRIVPRATCARNYVRDGIHVTPNMICATGMKKDSCAGDSGGPLVVKHANHYEQIGIVSFGKSCALKNFPGIYTNLKKFTNWVEQNTTIKRC